MADAALQARGGRGARGGDDDGLASDVGGIEEEQPRAEVTDSEPESEAGRDGARRPYIAWPRR